YAGRGCRRYRLPWPGSQTAARNRSSSPGARSLASHAACAWRSPCSGTHRREIACRDGHAVSLSRHAALSRGGGRGEILTGEVLTDVILRKAKRQRLPLPEDDHAESSCHGSREAP